MSVYKRGSRWAAALDIERAANGRRRRHYLGTFRSKKEAQVALRQAEHERDNGINLAPGTMTLADLLDRYQQSQKSRNLQSKTMQEDASKIRLHILPTIGGVSLAKLRPAQISELYATLLSRGRVSGKGGLSPKTVRHIHGILRAALAWALRMQLVGRNVAHAVYPPKAPRIEPRALSKEQVAELLRHANKTVLGPLFTLAFATGARRGELLALNWDSIDLHAGEIKFVSACRKHIWA